VYQLASRAERSDRARELVPPVDFRGRTLFDGSTGFELYQCLSRGAEIETIEATEPTDETQLRDRYGDRIVPMIVLTSSGTAKVCTTDGCPTARPGDRYLCLLDPPQQPHE
jgi:hypothetical protein